MAQLFCLERNRAKKEQQPYEHRVYPVCLPISSPKRREIREEFDGGAISSDGGILRTSYDLYLNIIDPPVPLFKIETFLQFLQFPSDHHDRGNSVLFTATRANPERERSRFFFLARRFREFSIVRFSDAKETFASLYAGHKPG